MPDQGWARRTSRIVTPAPRLRQASWLMPGLDSGTPVPLQGGEEVTSGGILVERFPAFLVTRSHASSVTTKHWD